MSRQLFLAGRLLLPPAVIARAARHQPATSMSHAALLVDKEGNLFGNWVFRLGMEEDRQDCRRDQSEPEWDEEKQRIINIALSAFRSCECCLQAFPEETPDEWSQSQNQQVEQALRTGADILREIFINENVDRGEEKTLGEAVHGYCSGR